MESLHTAAATPAARPLPRAGRLWQWLKREPLWQFLVLGSLLFAATQWVESRRTTAQNQIVIDDALEKRIARLTEMQSGIRPAGEQLDRLVQNYIDDEVMYREGLRMGLDRDDEIVRRRLIQKMQFLERDLAAAPTPSESDLRSYYESHSQMFASPASVAFDQLYFGADHGGWAQAEARARHAQGQLGSVVATSTGAADDAFPLQIPSEELTRADAGRLFGSTPIVDALFATPEGTWSGPFRSAYGWHLIKIDHIRTSALAPFTEVRGQVMAAYLQDQTQAADRRALDSLRARYTIVRPARPGALEPNRQ